MNYPLTFTKQIPDAQLIDLCDLLDGRTSPWLIATETDLEQAQVTVTHNRPGSETDSAVTTVITFTEILAVLAALHDEEISAARPRWSMTTSAPDAPSTPTSYFSAPSSAHPSIDNQEEK